VIKLQPVFIKLVWTYSRYYLRTCLVNSLLIDWCNCDGLNSSVFITKYNGATNYKCSQSTLKNKKIFLVVRHSGIKKLITNLYKIFNTFLWCFYQYRRCVSDWNELLIEIKIIPFERLKQKSGGIHYHFVWCWHYQYGYVKSIFTINRNENWPQKYNKMRKRE
jgi:hypothetical protein